MTNSDPKTFDPSTPDGGPVDASSIGDISIVDPNSLDASHPLWREWEQIAADNHNLYALFQSPQWWRYAIADEEDNSTHFLIVTRTVQGKLVMTIPVQKNQNYPMRFYLGKRSLGRMHMRTLRFGPGFPTATTDPELFARIVRHLFDSFPEIDCIVLDLLDEQEQRNRAMCQSADLNRLAHVYLPYAANIHYLIALQGTFSDYLSKFKPKTRSTLRRKVKRLRDYGDGQLDLLRIDHETEVSLFLKAASPISAQDRTAHNVGWHIENNAAERDRLMALARNGILRCYLLRCGEDICAFVRGFQHNGTYYYNRVGFDARYADYSPGTILLYLLIEDLFSHRPPHHLDFYSGDWSYKAQFATDNQSEITMLLVRRRLSSRLRVGRHEAFGLCIDLAKKAFNPIRSRISDAPR